MPWKFSGLPDYAYGYFSLNFFTGFCSDRPMNMRTKFEVRSFFGSEIIGGNQKISGSLWIWGSGMVPSERALVSSYRRSIVTFPLSLRVSEILCSSTPLFPTPPLVSPKFPPCSPGSRWMAFGLRRTKVLGSASDAAGGAYSATLDP